MAWRRGKGVIIAQTLKRSRRGARPLWLIPMVIEEFLEGEEVSFIVLCDGKRGVPLEPSQDHKRIFDGDQGPNTGGMGAYSDSRILTPAMRQQVMDTIIEPVIRATALHGLSLRRSDDDSGRTERARIQRENGRPGDSAAYDASRRAIGARR